MSSYHHSTKLNFMSPHAGIPSSSGEYTALAVSQVHRRPELHCQCYGSPLSQLNLARPIPFRSTLILSITFKVYNLTHPLRYSCQNCVYAYFSSPSVQIHFNIILLSLPKSNF
jgi:hypothetical protein